MFWFFLLASWGADVPARHGPFTDPVHCELVAEWVAAQTVAVLRIEGRSRYVLVFPGDPPRYCYPLVLPAPTGPLG